MIFRFKMGEVYHTMPNAIKDKIRTGNAVSICFKINTKPGYGKRNFACKISLRLEYFVKEIYPYSGGKLLHRESICSDDLCTNK